jgi:hypothetical protein
MSLVMAARGTSPPVRFWTPAPCGPKLIRYLICGKGGPFAIFICEAFLFGTIGNWLLFGLGAYGGTVLAAGFVATVLLLCVGLPLYSFGYAVSGWQTLDASSEGNSNHKQD